MDLVRRARGLADWWSDERPDDPVVLRCARGLLSTDARDRVLMLAGQAFIALVPLVIVAATATSTADGAAFAAYVVRRFDLEGDVADAVRSLFERPPDPESGLSLVSVVVLLVSVNSFSRSVRRTMERPWRLPKSGVRGAVEGLAGVVALIGTGVLVGWVGSLLDGGAVVWLLGLALQLAVSVVGWALTIRLFLTWRASWRAVLPGAVVGAVAQLVAGWGVTIFLPELITRNTERYGVIGVAIALVSWLIVLAAVIVTVGVVGGELARDRALPARRS